MQILAEIFGTYFLIFAGCGAVTVNQSRHGQITFPGVAIVWGLAVMVMVYALGHISGAHFNPAVTFAFATVRRKVSAALALAHVAAGWCDVTLGLDTKPWDIAAGALLVRRAGGRYLAYRYDDQQLPDYEAPCFMALGPDADYPAASTSLERIIEARRAQGFSH
jgi:hypothetical protein